MLSTMRVDLEKSRALLKEELLERMPREGDYPTPLKGLVLHRYDGNAKPRPVVYKPVIIVVIQGRKYVRIGAEEHRYGEHSCFVAGVDMPVASCVLEASPEVPYLSMSLDLDKGLIAQLAAEVPPVAGHGSGFSGGALVQDLDADLLDSFLRLAELMDRPEQIPVLEPLITQELHYRLLTGPFGNLLRSLHVFGSQSNQIARAVNWLRENYREPLQIDDLAGRLNMATSTFHKHFKEITTLSPLQYQKRLRLTEAQRLMLADDHGVTQAAYAVGYESPTQFIREYKRLFGEPPRRDVSRVRKPGS